MKFCEIYSVPHQVRVEALRQGYQPAVKCFVPGDGAVAHVRA